MKKNQTERRPMRRWLNASHEKRKELIVETALKLLDRYSMEAVTVRRVADKLGVGTMTLYTYFQNQRALKRAMVQRGFQMINDFCNANSTLQSESSWRGGAHSYVRFAVKHPNLYRLMFETRLAKNDHDVFHGGFQPLLEKVLRTMPKHDPDNEAFHKQAVMAAGRFWIALHGIATLATTGRLTVLHRELDEIIDDMIACMAPEVVNNS